MDDRQQFQKDLVDESKNGRVGADAQGQREPRHGSEQRRLAQSAERISQILNQGVIAISRALPVNTLGRGEGYLVRRRLSIVGLLRSCVIAKNSLLSGGDGRCQQAVSGCIAAQSGALITECKGHN
jgi:hypothetical protein